MLGMNDVTTVGWRRDSQYCAQRMHPHLLQLPYVTATATTSTALTCCRRCDKTTKPDVLSDFLDSHPSKSSYLNIASTSMCYCSVDEQRYRFINCDPLLTPVIDIWACCCPSSVCPELDLVHACNYHLLYSASLFLVAHRALSF